jgi:hypothetical protein
MAAGANESTEHKIQSGLYLSRVSLCAPSQRIDDGGTCFYTRSVWWISRESSMRDRRMGSRNFFDIHVSVMSPSPCPCTRAHFSQSIKTKKKDLNIWNLARNFLFFSWWNYDRVIFLKKEKDNNSFFVFLNDVIICQYSWSLKQLCWSCVLTLYITRSLDYRA